MMRKSMLCCISLLLCLLLFSGCSAGDVMSGIMDLVMHDSDTSETTTTQPGQTAGATETPQAEETMVLVENYTNAPKPEFDPKEIRFALGRDIATYTNGLVENYDYTIDSVEDGTRYTFMNGTFEYLGEAVYVYYYLYTEPGSNVINRSEYEVYKNADEFDYFWQSYTDMYKLLEKEYGRCTSMDYTSLDRETSLGSMNSFNENLQNFEEGYYIVFWNSPKYDIAYDVTVKDENVDKTGKPYYRVCLIFMPAGSFGLPSNNSQPESTAGQEAADVQEADYDIDPLGLAQTAMYSDIERYTDGLTEDTDYIVDDYDGYSVYTFYDKPFYFLEQPMYTYYKFSTNPGDGEIRAFEYEAFVEATEHDDFAAYYKGLYDYINAQYGESNIEDIEYKEYLEELVSCDFETLCLKIAARENGNYYVWWKCPEYYLVLQVYMDDENVLDNGYKYYDVTLAYVSPAD